MCLWCHHSRNNWPLAVAMHHTLLLCQPGFCGIQMLAYGCCRLGPEFGHSQGQKFVHSCVKILHCGCSCHITSLPSHHTAVWQSHVSGSYAVMKAACNSHQWVLQSCPTVTTPSMENMPETSLFWGVKAHHDKQCPYPIDQDSCTLQPQPHRAQFHHTTAACLGIMCTAQQHSLYADATLQQCCSAQKHSENGSKCPMQWQ